MIQKSLSILKELQSSNGLLTASKASVKTGYNRAWIRDNIYESLGFEATRNYKELVRIYRALLDVLLKHEYKIDWAIREKPKHAYQYIHARYDPETGDEILEEWGNKQNDAVGALLFKIGDLESKGVRVLRDKNDTRVIQKLVYYLESIEYWHDKDNGVWEEHEEVHASSVGACAAGLKAISRIVDVPKDLIMKGEKALLKLLPRESETKDVDLALLSLIYPYKIVSRDMALIILKNVEKKLVKEKGVIRYEGDQYYNKGLGEAEWVMGFPWLAIIYRDLKMPDKYAEYLRKTIACINEAGELPELYYANSGVHNENSPLGWAQALFLVAMAS
ncbi:glycoside hydrolase family 15 [Candidatus Woesearchaeota archaeon]|nr:glycoside hydrolase family 15 [Candidatus Woesearchaeota archaeon]